MKRWRDLNADEQRVRRNEYKRKSRAKKKGERPKVFRGFDAVWEKLKKKHAGKPRLEKSIKPPIYIQWPDDFDGRLVNGGRPVAK